MMPNFAFFLKNRQNRTDRFTSEVYTANRRFQETLLEHAAAAVETTGLGLGLGRFYSALMLNDIHGIKE